MQKKKNKKINQKVIGMIRKEENKPICRNIYRNWKYVSFLFYYKLNISCTTKNPRFLLYCLFLKHSDW